MSELNDWDKAMDAWDECSCVPKRLCPHAAEVRKASEALEKEETMLIFKSALEVVMTDFPSLSESEKIERVSGIGKIVAGSIPFGYTSALLAGMADKEYETGSDHVAEALEKAVAVIDEAEES